MDEPKSNINDEMKSAAGLAIKTAKERYGLKLDFSEPSIINFDGILGHIRRDTSGSAQVKLTGRQITETAIFWGSYLGEYMCNRWGCRWIRKGSAILVIFQNIYFSPISFVYQKLTSHPDYSSKIYLFEASKVIYNCPAIDPQPMQYLRENTGQPDKKIVFHHSNKTIAINQRKLLTLAGIVGALLVIAGGVIGYMRIRTGSIATSELLAADFNRISNIPLAEPTPTSITFSTFTRIPSPTILPTYTPKPTHTLQSSLTSFSTKTAIPTPTSTQTATPTRASALLKIRPTLTPSNTGIPPTPIIPTTTVPEPITIKSCGIDPSVVPIGINSDLAFIVHFSSPTPGLGFSVKFDTTYPDQQGCSGTDPGDGHAFCIGKSGTIPLPVTVQVTLQSPAGDCIVSYNSR